MIDREKAVLANLTYISLPYESLIEDDSGLLKDRMIVSDEQSTKKRRVPEIIKKDR